MGKAPSPEESRHRTFPDERLHSNIEIWSLREPCQILAANLLTTQVSVWQRSFSIGLHGTSYKNEDSAASSGKDLA
jgi:hypothetical protein